MPANNEKIRLKTRLVAHMMDVSKYVSQWS